MTDRDTMLRYILDNPDDDTARLVYADKIQESGKPWDGAHAELIRLQVGRVGAAVSEVTHSLQREEAILKKWGAKWLPPVARFDWGNFGVRVQGDWVTFPGATHTARYAFERGFLGSVSLERHGLTGFRVEVVGELVRQAIACRPVRLFEFRMSGFSPALELVFARAGDDWRADLKEIDADPGDDPSGHTLIVPDRKTLVAGVSRWLIEALDEVEWERVVEYADEIDDGFPDDLDEIPH